MTELEIEQMLIDNGCEHAAYFTNPSYDTAIVGVTNDDRVVYDYDKMVEFLMDTEGWTEIESIEWIEINAMRAIPFMGSQSPIIMYKLI